MNILHHIAIACESLEKGYRDAGRVFKIKSSSDIVYDPNQDAYLQMLYCEDGTSIELVSGNAVLAYVKRGIKLYHLCFEVENIEKAITEQCNQGFILIREARPALLFDNRRVAFLMTSLGLIEFIEKGEQHA